MKMHSTLLAGTAMALIALSSGAYAQNVKPTEDAEKTEPVEASGDTENRTEIVNPTGVPGEADADIIVVGIRGSVASAANKKKNAKQIVDTIVAEDVGKLPDNNVVDAISRITGVQIDRSRGQGQSVAIRGLDGVQTTINGNNSNLGAGRSVSLADIPAELLKSVDVYKTRSADQVEGSIAGTVNVELRRPLDLPVGLTFAGSVKGVYDDIADKVSPFASLLISDRFETGIGEMGFLINASYQKSFYRENYIESESPDVVCCGNEDRSVIFENTPAQGLPAEFKNIIVPYRVYYGLEEGSTLRPSLNAAFQWRPSDNLDVVLEGSYIGSDNRNSSEQLYLLTREGSPLTYSNIAVQPDGKTATSFTLSNPNGLIGGLVSTYNRSENDLYNINFETHWRNDIAQLNFGAQYSWSNSRYYFVQQVVRPPQGITTANVNFFSDQYSSGGGVPTFELPGIDLTNPANYGLERFQDNGGEEKNNELTITTDLTLKTSEEGFLRNLQFGLRYNQRTLSRYYGYRDGFPRVNGAFAPVSSLPGGDQASLTGPDFPGAQQWIRVPGQVVYDRAADYLVFIRQTDPGNATRFTGERPPADRGQTFDNTENNFAFYGQANYSFKLGFPIDGFAGLRIVNRYGTSSSFNFRPGNAANGFQDIVDQSSVRANFVDALPSAMAIVHITDKAQVRFSYSTNVSFPGFYDIRPFYFAETRNVPPIIFAGNPNLKAQRDKAYDISAEYYFGRGGQLSLAGYYKTATGFLYYSREPVDDLSAYNLPGQSGFVEQVRNAGDGSFAGIEATAQSFFDFAPGFLKNFGVSVNGSYVIEARVEYPYPEDFPGAFDSPNTSTWTANAALFYDTPAFSARVAFNYRSAFRLGVFTANPSYSPYQDDTYRLDAALNYTPFKFITLSLEGGNLLGNDVYRYFGQDQLIPLGVRTLGRTVQASARFRF